MPVDDIKPTRFGLLIVRRRMALAERIHRLLAMKLDGMMLELVRLTDQTALKRRELDEKYTVAREMVAVAAMMEGATGVLLAALSVETSPTYTTGHKNVFGVRLPDLEPVMVKKALVQRGYGILGTSSVIDDAADAYEDLLGAIIASAELEGGGQAAARRYRTDPAAGERAGVQGHPGAYGDTPVEIRRFIESQRDEMERQEWARLRRIKKIKAKRAGKP